MKTERPYPCMEADASAHPILWNVPETDYLKFYLFQIA